MRSPGSRSSTSGYGRQEVVDAIADQAARMPFAVSNIFANEPAIALAERIARLTPGDLDHVNFTSGGSEAVEVALKMARQYHVVRGEPDARCSSGAGRTTTARRSAG